MLGAQILVSSLERNGVSVIFGYPGAANCPIIDCLSDSSIKCMLTRTEQGAAHMASGYSRVKKAVGVCMSTSGPGATNLITGIATAYMDSVPMVIITGQVATDLVGRDAFQEIDITGATMPFTKHNYLICDTKSISRIVDEAFYIANSGRPGPVLIDVPMDIMLRSCEDAAPEHIHIRGYKAEKKLDEKQIKKIYPSICKSKKPIILAGGGVVLSDATKELREFADKTKIPVLCTMNGIGAMPPSSPLFFGMVGCHGSKAANYGLNNADLVIIAGARLGDRSVLYGDEFEASSKIIHIDIDAAEIGKNIQPYIPIVGDAKEVFSALNSISEKYNAPIQWHEELNKKVIPTSFDAGKENFVNPKLFIDKLWHSYPSLYISTEVGQNQLWTINNYHFDNPRHLITSAGFGTMGYGLPAAIGASVGTNATVMAIMGDGSFQMDFAELATMKQWNVNVKLVLFLNNSLGLVRELQKNEYNSNYQCVTLDGSPDFLVLAKAYGIDSMKISSDDEISLGIENLMKDDKPYLLVVNVDPNESTL